MNFQDILNELILTKQARKGTWFSLPAMKIEGKIFAAQWLNGDMIFKSRGEDHARP